MRCHRKSRHGNRTFPVALVVRIISSPVIPPEKRAKELRKVCSEQRIPMDDVAKAIEHFLKSKKVGDALIQEQVERARKFLKLS